MPKHELWRYGGALIALLAATLLRQLLDPVLGSFALIPLFLMAVVLTGLYAGRGPALMILFVGAPLTNYLFEDTRGSLPLLDPKFDLGFGLQMIVGLLIIWATEQLRSSRRRELTTEARLRAAAQAGAFGTFDLDLVTGKIEWSEEAYTVLGLASGQPIELDANHIAKAVHPDDYERMHQALQAALDITGPGVLEAEPRILRPDGVQRWVRSKGKVFFSGSGPRRKATRITGAIHDITERKLAEAQLQQHAHALQERLKELECLHVAARLTEAIDWSDDVLARLLQSVMSAYQYPEVTCVRVEVEGRMYQTENFQESLWRQRSPICTSERNFGYVEVAYTEARPVADEGPFLKEERSLIDAVASLLAASLHRRLDRSALAESETRLRHLVQELKEADHRKDVFLATLAHELRNPLTPIRNAFALISRGGDRPELVNKALGIGERQMVQLIRIVDDLLDIARINSGKIALNLERVGLRSVVDQAVESSRPQIDAGKHRLAVELPETDVQLQIDPLRMAQALSNLLNNAAKYTDSGGRIRVTARVESECQELVIAVEDNGIGILQENLPYVFDVFLQGAQSRHQIWQGLGVGLPLARSLVELHGGRVMAASQGLGNGCTFSIRLPLQDAAAAGQPGQGGEGSADLPIPPLRVLVVDDDKDVAESTAMLLQEDGHDVLIANDGAVAVELALAYVPSVVLMDIGLAGMSGYDVARTLRAQEKLNATWLVALTGWGTEHDRRQSKEAGFDHHLVKPVEAGALGDLLRACASGPSDVRGDSLVEWTSSK